MPTTFRRTPLRAWALAAAWVAVAPAFGAESLIDAVKAKHHDGALALINQGADVRAHEPDGTTALHWAAYNADAALVERLIRAGADVSAVNDYGSSPMQEAAVTADPLVLRSLLRAGANVDSPNPEGQTALMVVAR